MTAKQKQSRVDIATSLKQRFMAKDDGLLLRIVAIDEMRIRDFEPELKKLSSDWKQMMIYAYDHRSVMVTDRVPCGKSITEAYHHDILQKLCRKMHKNHLTCLQMGILYDKHVHT